jgi:hypothetical protein
MRQAAKQLGVHRDALKAAFAHWELPCPSGGWAGSPVDRGKGGQLDPRCSGYCSPVAATEPVGLHCGIATRRERTTAARSAQLR